MTEKSAQQAHNEQTAHTTSAWIYRGAIYSVRSDFLQCTDGTTKQRDIIVHPGAAVIVPVQSNGALLLVKQWRRAAQRILLELPAGTLEPGEQPIDCAQRELQEETGYRADCLTPLGGFYSAPGFCTEYLHLFIANGLQESPLVPDDGEAIDVTTLHLEELLRLIDKGEICDAKTIAGALRYARWLTS